MPKVLFFIPNHFYCLVDFHVHVLVPFKQAVDFTLEISSFIPQVVAEFELLVKLITKNSIVVTLVGILVVYPIEILLLLDMCLPELLKVV